jgi:DNA-binding response OmpR family regulator
MYRQKRVLVVEDLQKWREALTDILQREGFNTDSASTMDEVRERINETFHHLLLLDIRLNESDPTNQEGIDLLRELDERGLSEAMKVIMISALGTPENMRVVFAEHGVVDFISKDKFKKQEFLETVQRVFSTKVNINLALKVHWQQAGGPEQAVLNLVVNGIRVKRNTPLQSQIALELDDLLCRLFYKAESVLMQPLTPGQSGTGVLQAQPFFPTGGGRTVVVKFGNADKIEEEYSNFKKYVQPFVGGGRNTNVLTMRRTSHLGGIMYSLLGAASDQLEDFGSFYRHANVSQIKEALDRLFLDTCSAWYANAGKLLPHDLSVDYQQLLGFTREKLEQALNEKLKSVQGKQELKFNSLISNRKYTNPILAVADSSLVRPTYICITHGDFNQHNILVDRTGYMWLIDFQGTGPGHILRDVAKLDSEVRFQLLAPEEASLEERLQMEEILCSIDRFSKVEQLAANLPTENQALSKAFATVVHLRTLARKLVWQNPSDDISEYYIALLYNALNTLRFYSLPTIQREHALLSASLLTDQLGLRV